MIDMGPISFYLGSKVERDRDKQTIKLFQPAYFDKVFSRFHFDKAHTITTSIKESAKLKTKTDSQASTAEQKIIKK